MPAARIAVSWHFDTVVVDSGTHRVLVKGVPQPLEPKSFKLLQFLIENRDRVVSKQEIFDAVWAGTFVTDNALTRAIEQVRKALGDDSKDSRYIKTIPTIGYRFVATVREVPHEQARLDSPDTYVRYPDWMVGDRVVYEFNETKGNIFVVDLKR